MTNSPETYTPGYSEPTLRLMLERTAAKHAAFFTPFLRRGMSLLAQKPPAALRTTKMLLKTGQANVIKEAMAREGQQFAALLQGPEAKEAMAAFMERRKADFSRF